MFTTDDCLLGQCRKDQRFDSRLQDAISGRAKDGASQSHRGIPHAVYFCAMSMEGILMRF